MTTTKTTKTAKTYGGQATIEQCLAFARESDDTTDIMIALHGAGKTLAELARVHGAGIEAARNVTSNRDGTSYTRREARQAVARWTRYARAEAAMSP